MDKIIDALQIDKPIDKSIDKPILSKKVELNLNTIYNRIKGKKVFIFDLETTGLFDIKNFYKYWDNTVFDSARIVEIGYYYSDNFDTELNISYDANNNVINKELFDKSLIDKPLIDILNCLETDKITNETIETTNETIETTNETIETTNDFTINNIIHSYLRKPTNFNSIDPIAESKHGISIEQLKNSGYKFSHILNKDLLIKLTEAEYIISHNTMFDFNILLNELNRFKLSKTIKHLLDIKKNNCLLCTCRASGYMTLEKLYFSIFNDKPDVFHRAGDDVKTLVEIITKKKLDTVYKYEL
jgi:hypothetical protein